MDGGCNAPRDAPEFIIQWWYRLSAVQRDKYADAAERAGGCAFHVTCVYDFVANSSNVKG
jgi:hypothetical protein